MITFFAPPLSICTRALLASVKRPVDSMTSSTPRSFHGSSAGSLWLRNFTERPSTLMASSGEDTAGPNVPRAVSCFKRCANVCASPMSFTATISKSGLSSLAARKMLRPIRPKPLIPTFKVMWASSYSWRAKTLGPNPGGETPVKPGNDRRNVERSRVAPFGRLEVEPAIHLTAHFAHPPHALELHDRAARPHQGKQAHDRVTFFEVGDMLAGALHQAHPHISRAGHFGHSGRPRIRGDYVFEVVARARHVDRAASQEETAQHRLPA